MSTTQQKTGKPGGWLLTEMLVAIAIFAALIATLAVAQRSSAKLNKRLLAHQRCLAAAQAQLDSIAATGLPISDENLQRLWPGIEVELNIVEYVWLRVLVDGEEAFVGSLEAGTTRTFRGRESVILRCGNAGGVEATVNGEPLGLLGERGQVVDIEWLAEGITPTPATPEATVTPTATPST